MLGNCRSRDETVKLLHGIERHSRRNQGVLLGEVPVDAGRITGCGRVRRLRGSLRDRLVGDNNGARLRVLSG